VASLFAAAVIGDKLLDIALANSNSSFPGELLHCFIITNMVIKCELVCVAINAPCLSALQLAQNDSCLYFILYPSQRGTTYMQISWMFVVTKREFFVCI